MTPKTTRDLYHRATSAYGHYCQMLDKTQQGQRLDEIDIYILRESIKSVESAMQSCLQILEESDPQQ